MSRKELVARALKLSAKDRADLAHRLLRSLDGAADPDAGRLWIAEIERRAESLKRGEGRLTDWETLRRKLLKRSKSR